MVNQCIIKHTLHCKALLNISVHFVGRKLEG